MAISLHHRKIRRRSVCVNLFILFACFGTSHYGNGVLRRRASQKSIATSFNVLEKEGTKWHIYRYFGMAGNYLLMMFYTTIGGWMLAYFVKMLKGDFVGLNPDRVGAEFAKLTTDMPTMIFWMAVIVIIGFLVCSMGLQSGVERINKIMMVVLLGLMVVLAINSCLLPGASEGLKFYLLPDFGNW